MVQGASAEYEVTVEIEVPLEPAAAADAAGPLTAAEGEVEAQAHPVDTVSEATTDGEVAVPALAVDGEVLEADIEAAVGDICEELRLEAMNALAAEEASGNAAVVCPILSD